MPERALDLDWISAVMRRALGNPSYLISSRSLDGWLQLRADESTVSIRLKSGTPVDSAQGISGAPTYVLSGSAAQWTQALRDAPDLPAAQDPNLGGLTLTGDHVKLAGNAKALMLLWQAMRAEAAGPTNHCSPDGSGKGDGRPELVSGPELVGRYVDVMGYRTYYESAGNGPAVVCIHSGGADGRAYRHLLSHLPTIGVQAIALDMPGHGKSYPDLDTLRPIETAENWIEFVVEFSRALGLDRPVLVGCAMSASLLLRLAAEHPEVPAAIISANGTPDFTTILDEDYLDALNHPQVNVGDFLESQTAGLVGRDLTTIARNECLWHNARNLTPEVMQADITIYARHNILAVLSDISTPVLHLRGEFDPTVTEEGMLALRDGLPDATFVNLTGVGHLPMVEDPAQFNSAVERFLQRLLER